MRWKIIHLPLWTLGALLYAGMGLATEMPGAPETASSWPWLALGAIVLLLTVIALAARRRLPFGTRL